MDEKTQFDDLHIGTETLTTEMNKIIIETFITSLAYLNEKSLKVICETDYSDQQNMKWIFKVINEDEKVDQKYVVDDIVGCIFEANKHVGILLKNNPFYTNKAYLISVGIEQALQQYRQPISIA